MNQPQESSGDTKWGKRWAANGLLLCLVIAFCLGVGEGLVRGFVSRIVLFPRYHTDAVYGEFTLRRLRPNMEFWHTSADGSWKFITNAQGFRDVEDYSYEKPDGVLRVLSLGDSQTQGFEVRQDQTFSEISERFLKEHGFKAQVFNTGISGFGMAEQLAFLENEGIKYKPDVVLVGFYANDFEDNIKAGLFALENGTLVVKKTTHIPGVRILNIINEIALNRWLSENSYLYSLTLNTVWNWSKRLLLTRAEARLQTEFSIRTEEITEYNRDLMVRLLERLYAFCREHGIRLIILDVPRRRRLRGPMVESSVPPNLIPAFRANSDIFLPAETVFAKFRREADIHMPNGQNHISEYGHRELGLAAGRAILRVLGRR